MSELRFDAGVLRLAPGGLSDAGLAISSLARLLFVDRDELRLPIDEVAERGDALVAGGRAGDFSAEALWRAVGGDSGRHAVELRVSYHGARPIEAGLRIEARVLGGGRPRWLIPGLFYGENRLPGNRRTFPRWDPAGGEPAELVSDHWSFRADRSALPAVFAWSEGACVALCTDEMGQAGEQGIGFAGNAQGVSIWIDAPYREEPVVYAAPGEPRPAAVAAHRWQPGEALTIRFTAYAAPPDPHAYDALVRAEYSSRRGAHRLNPWLEPAAAAQLAAHGLHRWHFRAEHAALFETAAFDRESPGAVLDRPHMHVAWVSGAPWAAALLAHGRRARVERYTAAAISVLDLIASGLAPCGAFWGEWRVDSGWGAGWNLDGQLHARTLAEATLFMVRALAAEEGEAPHPGWQTAVRSNLEYVTAHQRDDGNCGAYYDPHSGKVTGWQGAAGMLWIAALAEASAVMGEPGWRHAARRAGDYYARFVDEELIYGAPEDVHLTPTSEDGYNAVIAYVRLWEATGEDRWLDLACRAADWTMTFRYTYNVSFPPHTILADYDFRTRGADQASPSNQHLHAYGLIALPEMMALWRATGDDYYLERSRDSLACFLQFVARRDGDFNARRGMVTERFYQTTCFGPKGSLLTLSHAWSVGVLLHACLAALDDPDAIPVEARP